MDVSKLIAVIKSVAQIAVPGAPAAIAAAKAVYDLATHVAPTLAEDDQRKLQQALPAILGMMNADVDAAIKALKGDQ